MTHPVKNLVIPKMRKAAATRRTTVCLMSHHALVLAELRRMLSGPKFSVRIWQPESMLPRDLRGLVIPRASVYVLDAQAPRPATDVLVAGLLERFPAARLLIVAERFNDATAFPLLRLGAKGLLRYADARPQLPLALRAVAAGGFWVSRSMLSRFLDSILGSLRGRRLLGAPANLSRREREVFDALMENLANKEIASKLNVSERTVKFHVSNLLAKFGVRRRADLILLCYQAQITSP